MGQSDLVPLLGSIRIAILNIIDLILSIFKSICLRIQSFNFSLIFASNGISLQFKTTCCLTIFDGKSLWSNENSIDFLDIIKLMDTCYSLHLLIESLLHILGLNQFAHISFDTIHLSKLLKFFFND